MGVQWERDAVLALRANGDLALFGVGRGRAELGGPFILMDGATEIEGGVTPILGTAAGGPPTEIVGMDGVTETEGVLTLEPLDGAGDSLTDITGTGGTDDVGAFTPGCLPEALTAIVGISWTAIVGMEGMEDGLVRIEGA